MLRELHIENFALIDNLTVAFGGGLNILTGETGAGKSIIIDALNQVLGERSAADLVRTGERQAVISAVVELNETVVAQLTELGYTPAEDIIILQRDIYASGKSQARIDGRPVNVSALRQVGSLLVEIHGQHEHQALLDSQTHLDMVDAFGGEAVTAARDAYQDVWMDLDKYKKELTTLHGDKRERQRLLDMLKFQVDEIEQAQLQPNEEEELLGQRTMLQNARKLLEACHGGYQTLYDGGDQPAVTQVLATVVDSLKEFRDMDDMLKQACSQLEESYYAVEDAARQLRNFSDNFVFDPQRLEQVEQRLDLISDLKRKYADSVPGILAWRDEKLIEIQDIENTESRHAELIELIDTSAQIAGKRAAELSRLRDKAGQRLAQAIVEELAYLQMDQTRFVVENRVLEDDQGIPVEGRMLRATSTGIDSPAFMISPNPGEPLKPLTKVASGGELSRVMLAILNVLANLRPVQTMVFDEIDAGIGGRAAQAVAEKLAAVSDQRQVICVSHLPQVTSMADHHLHIFKQTQAGRTVTQVSRLDIAGRVEELARMLGGAEVTAATISHAKDMLSLASKKNLDN